MIFWEGNTGICKACSAFMNLLKPVTRSFCCCLNSFRLITARKNLAVPFRAAKTPAERSEFAQPEIAQLLTQLSYYNDGLSKEQMLVALTVLLGMGRNEQARNYQSWLKSSMGGIEEGEGVVNDNYRRSRSCVIIST